MDPTDYTECLFRGMMLTVDSVWSSHQTMLLCGLTQKEVNHRIKKELAYRLAEKILAHGLCETTMQKRIDDDSMVMRARCFLLPDDQVQILRTQLKGMYTDA
jgi:hypothetical protein